MKEAWTINTALVSCENRKQNISREQEQRKVTMMVLSFHGNWVSAFYTDEYHKVFGK